jgi:formylglycine-generating enzyme required for sulfatase activity
MSVPFGVLISTLLFSPQLFDDVVADKAECPDDMRLIEGVHHEQLERICVDYRNGKCWGFFPNLAMMEPRHTQIATCMDLYEWPNQKGKRPQVMMSFIEAEKMCAAKGKRMCTEFEWELACEGPQHRPWPWGWERRGDVCNNDKRYRAFSIEKVSSSDKQVRDREVARIWQGAPSGAYPECKTHAGVMDMVGNVEEWVATSRKEWPHRSSLKGGYWSKQWAGCRGTNDSHSPQFRFYEIGFRCCRAPSPG